MSFAVLYIRILPQNFLLILNKILVAFLVCQAIEESLVVIFKCSPVEAAYHENIPGSCLNIHVLWWTTVRLHCNHTRVIANSRKFIFNICTDLILFIQPLPSIWHLQMTIAKRVGLTAMMSLGLLYRLFFGTKSRCSRLTCEQGLHHLGSSDYLCHAH